MTQSGTGRICAGLLMLGTAGMLALNLPGQMSYDSVSQLLQGRSGHYNSWHPPVMAWLLGLFDSLLPGTGLFLIFDTLLLLGGWLLLLRLGPRPGWTAPAVALILLLTPQFLLHQGTVWKDMLFTDSAIAGFAALAMAAKAWDTRWRWLALSSGLLLVLAALARRTGADGVAAGGSPGAGLDCRTPGRLARRSGLWRRRLNVASDAGGGSNPCAGPSR